MHVSRDQRKKCLFPECKKMTGSQYPLCNRHYQAQLTRLKNGNIKHMRDLNFISSKDRDLDEAFFAGFDWGYTCRDDEEFDVLGYEEERERLCSEWKRELEKNEGKNNA